MTSDSESTVSPPDMSEVTIGVLTALEEEYAACRGVFDPTKCGSEQSKNSKSGSFTCWVCAVPTKNGGRHVVAISLLADMGNTAAAIGANILLQHCAKVRSLIMCGIAGAVPHPTRPEDHVRLGDIVVTDKSGIIQYDRGKQRDPRGSGVARIPSSAGGGLHWLLAAINSIFRSRSSQRHSASQTTSDGEASMSSAGPLEGFEYRGSARPPCPELLGAVRRIHADEATLGIKDRRRWDTLVDDFISNVGNSEKWSRPTSQHDILNDSAGGFGPAILHPCDSQRRSGRPRVFRGPIGAANVVQADPLRRDALRDRHKIKAVEMEGSGVADAGWIGHVGYLVIRGTCDYCNSTKSDAWHYYAALIAAAYARTVIEHVHSDDTSLNNAGVEHIQSGSNQFRPTFDLVTVPGVSETNVRLSRSPLDPSGAGEQKSSVPIEFVDASTSPVLGPEERVPAPDASQRIETELDSYRILRIADLSQTVRRLLDESRLADIDGYCADLERELRLLPHKGDKVARGWTVLAQVEIHKARVAKEASRPFELTRLNEFRLEVEKCH